MKLAHLAFLLLIISATTCQDTTDTETTTTTTVTNDPTTGNLEIYDGLAFGVGKGTVAVAAFAVVGLIICFLKDCSPTPSLLVAIGIIIPLLVLAIIWGLPKEPIDGTATTIDEPTDSYRIRTGVFSAIIFLMCILSCFIAFGSRANT